jgi:hypothetical protein
MGHTAQQLTQSLHSRKSETGNEAFNDPPALLRVARNAPRVAHSVTPATPVTTELLFHPYLQRRL